MLSWLPTWIRMIHSPWTNSCCFDGTCNLEGKGKKIEEIRRSLECSGFWILICLTGCAYNLLSDLCIVLYGKEFSHLLLYSRKNLAVLWWQYTSYSKQICWVIDLMKKSAFNTFSNSTKLKSNKSVKIFDVIDRRNKAAD